jgi:Cu(I)-responsive transcriptional regulator
MPMKISEASAMTGVSEKMIRHYECIGLIAKPRRAENQYRYYEEPDLRVLKFIRRARSLGFSLKDIRQLLALWRNHSRMSASVKAIALGHIRELDEKAAALQAMSRTLKDLVKAYPGDSLPDCPILGALSQFNGGNGQGCLP